MGRIDLSIGVFVTHAPESRIDLTSDALRERAARIRRYMQRYASGDVAAALEEVAADLDTRAEQMEAEQSRLSH